MKKRIIRCFSLILALGLLVGLAACGEKKAFEPAEVAEKLNESGCFSEPLEKMDRAIYVRYLGLDDTTIMAGAVYASTGATAEELAVVSFTDDAAAQKAEEALKAHLEDQIAANKDYRPDDMPKLEKAVVERRKNSVLLLVAADYGPAAKIIG